MMLIRAPIAFVAALAVVAFAGPVAVAQHEPPPGLMEDEHAAGEAVDALAEDAVAGNEHAVAGEVNTNPLEFRKDLAIWTAVVFLVLLLVLWKFAWAPIIAGLDKRERGIADQITSAERSNEEARRLLAQYEEKLACSENDVRKMLDDAKRGAQKVGQEIVHEARADAEAEHRRALAEIELATAGALKELAEQSATLAVELAGKIVQARLDPAAHAKLIEDAVAGFSSTTPGNN
jgi:F-type H+-transporting ATPase subunit b